MEIQPTLVKASVLLSKKEGNILKEHVMENIDGTFKSYCRSVGLQDTNVYRWLNGSRPAEIDTIQKLLSGMPMEHQWSIKLVFSEELRTEEPEVMQDFFE